MTMTTLPKMELFCRVGFIFLYISCVRGITRLASCSVFSPTIKVDGFTAPPSKETAEISFSEMPSYSRSLAPAEKAARVTLVGAPAVRAAWVARRATRPNMMGIVGGKCGMGC